MCASCEAERGFRAIPRGYSPQLFALEFDGLDEDTLDGESISPSANHFPAGGDENPGICQAPKPPATVQLPLRRPELTLSCKPNKASRLSDLPLRTTLLYNRIRIRSDRKWSGVE